MNDISSMNDALAKSRQSAMVDFYLGQVVVNAQVAERAPVTLDDLDHYHLLDHQVQTPPRTSVVGELIASLQRYIHGAFAGEEPGFTGNFDPEVLAYWRNWESRYDIWAGAEQLRSYPENYIDATLRLRKSEFFKTLENDLGQARLNKDRARMAILNYLRAFEEVANLDVISGYIDGIDHLDAPYYLIGRHKTAPYQYFLRRADVVIGEAQTRLDPSAWDEWHSIGVKLGADVPLVRPVCVAGRLFLVWLERTEFEEPETRDLYWVYSLQHAYQDLNGLWSPSTLLKKFNAPYDVNFSLMALGFESFEKRDAALAIALVSLDDEKQSVFYAWNTVFDPITLTPAQISALNIVARDRYSDPATLQRRFPNIDGIINATDLQIDGIEIEQVPGTGPHPINAGLTLHANYFVKQVEDDPQQGYMDVLAECHSAPDFHMFKSGRLTVSILFTIGGGDYNHTVCHIDLKISANGQLGAIVRRTTGSLKTLTLSFKGQELATLRYSSIDYGDDDFLMILLEKPSPSDLDDLTLAQCTAGAGFSVETEFFPSWAVGDTRFQGSAFIFERHSPEHEFSLSVDGNVHWTKMLTINGGIAERSTSALPSVSDSHVFSFGATDPKLGRNNFTVHLKARDDNAPKIVAASTGGQFLAFDESDFVTKWVRLNTTFTGALVQRASMSLERLLDWDTQHTPEPPFPDSPSKAEILDFNGANGRYFWEIFFHLPHLVARQLKTEMSYEDALDWLHFLFDPARPVQPAETATPLYWRVRPLVEDGDQNHEVSAPADPDAIAYSQPVHYRKRIFRDYVETLIAWGDTLYRQVSRDSLTEAKMLYLRASRMMGQAPEFKSAARWTPTSLAELDGQDDTARFAAIEAEITDAELADLAPHAGGPLVADLLSHPAFFLPLNRDLLSLWETIASRLYNLRHHLTIDGKPMQLPLYDTPIHPTDLLLAQAADGGFHRRDLGSATLVLPYRFISVLPRAKQAVSTLCRFGDQMRQFMEQGDRTEQEVLQQKNLIEISQFAVQLQEEMLVHAQGVRDSLAASRVATQIRHDRFKRLYEEDLSPNELQANASLMAARVVTTTLDMLNVSAKLIELSPKIFGMAVGNARYGAMLEAASKTGELASKVQTMTSTALDRTEGFRRRRAEWLYQVEIADAEMRMIDRQVAAQDIQIQASRTSLAQQIRSAAQAEEMYTFLTQTRGSRTSLYRWMQSRMATLYFQAYDAATALCQAAQAGWRYEIGDYETNFITPGNWQDSHYGLTAGEALSLAMTKMESAFLHRHERRMVLRKTVSLKALAGDGWDSLMQQLRSTGKCAFALTHAMFDEDYPGHYLRQLLRVAVTLPSVLGPYEMLSMKLVQTSSLIVIKSDILAVRYVYDPIDPNADPTNVRHNLRTTPQVGISSGLDDDGTGTRLIFDFERYEPFERMGAVSTWAIEFPRHESAKQIAIFDAMTDIILHIEYNALDGGPDFAADVEELLTHALDAQ
ncbi:Tc toxin subunit A-related protein [Pandoraea sputorum]|uniref:Insecticidal toxin complex protein TcaB2 n=1 Tax=Pandoraea sputorum TaxID=93222 RepID=A0A5E5AWX9_9BURK|nr:neuraminidase-like domain-containing protein [Pandoraea sputorum]VVE77442.1 hypothetical protein PSP31121_01043 [Pandoraea sputorum]